MGSVVAKFGGSVLASGEDLRRVGEIVRQYPKGLVIVVSALAGVTDRILSAIRVRDDTHRIRIDLVEFLRTRHRRAADEAIRDSALRRRTSHRGEAILARLDRSLHEASGDRSELAFVASCGERLSSVVLEGVLLDQGLPCRVLLPEAFGLFTTDEEPAPRIDLARSIPWLKHRFHGSERSIVPGFYGVLPTGEFTLLGRGGSDYTAAALGRCLNASSVDLWKDVEGFRTADPRLVSGTRSIDRLTYEEAAESIHFGARILHPRSIGPLVEARIPLRLFSVMGPADIRNPETVIGGGAAEPSGAKSVSFRDDLVLLEARRGVDDVHGGLLTGVGADLEREGIIAQTVMTSRNCLYLVVEEEVAARAIDLVRSRFSRSTSVCRVVANASVVALIGEGMRARSSIPARALAALARRGIRPLVSFSGLGALGFCALVSKHERTEALRLVHKELFVETASSATEAVSEPFWSRS